MNLQKIEPIFNKIYTFLLFLLVVGTPLLFTSYTRSVFEVNKLLLLRVVTILIYCIWFFQHIYYKANVSEYRTQKIGLEIPLFIWVVTNIVSTVLSQNFLVSIIGSYDRWEGIFTVFNYVLLLYMFAKLVTTKRLFFWLAFGILISTGFSAFYGVFQSLGYDFMNWSKDPTSRVFACINNPVHFCAYVAMTVPLGISLLLFFANQTKQALQTLFKPLLLTVYGSIALIGLVSLVKFTSFFLVVFAVCFPFLLSIAYQRTFNKSLLFGLSPIYVGAFVSCVIGIRTYCFTSFSITFFQMSILVTLFWLAFEQSKTLVPTKKQALYVGCVTGLCLIFTIFDWITFSKEQWFGLGFVVSFFYMLSALPNRDICIKRGLFICVNLIFYTQILSFSRATWIGYVIMLPNFYLMATHAFKKESIRHYFTDIALTFLMTFCFCLIFIFKVLSFSVFGLLPLLIFLGCFLSLVYLSHRWDKRSFSLSAPILNLSLIMLALMGAIFFNTAKLPPSVVLSIKVFLLACIPWLSQKLDTSTKPLAERLFIIMLFALVQYTGSSLYNILFYTALCLGYYFVALKKNADMNREKKFWLLAFLFSFMGFMIIPSFPTLVESLHLVKAKTETHSLLVSKNIAQRTQSYAGDHDKNARISMWKSGLPWFKDYPFFGSGLDTVKYMYPVYRRPEYGILEGGHNYTPDRLHNEYINTLVTRGAVGFIAYYLLLIPFWGYLVFKGVFNHYDSSFRYIVAGCVSGVGIYLGQVIFNFGVVATLVLFYMLMGLALAVVIHPEFHDVDQKN